MEFFSKKAALENEKERYVMVETSFIQWYMIVVKHTSKLYWKRVRMSWSSICKCSRSKRFLKFSKHDGKEQNELPVSLLVRLNAVMTDCMSFQASLLDAYKYADFSTVQFNDKLKNFETSFWRR